MSRQVQKGILHFPLTGQKILISISLLVIKINLWHYIKCLSIWYFYRACTCILIYVWHFSLCVVLLTKAGPEHNSYRDSFRDYIETQAHEDQRVRYAYVYADTQKDFVSSLIMGRDLANKTSGALKVCSFVLMYRI